MSILKLINKKAPLASYDFSLGQVPIWNYQRATHKNIIRNGVLTTLHAGNIERVNGRVAIDPGGFNMLNRSRPISGQPNTNSGTLGSAYANTNGITSFDGTVAWAVNGDGLRDDVPENARDHCYVRFNGPQRKQNTWYTYYALVRPGANWVNESIHIRPLYDGGTTYSDSSHALNQDKLSTTSTANAVAGSVKVGGGWILVYNCTPTDNRVPTTTSIFDLCVYGKNAVLRGNDVFYYDMIGCYEGYGVPCPIFSDATSETRAADQFTMPLINGLGVLAVDTESFPLARVLGSVNGYNLVVHGERTVFEFAPNVIRTYNNGSLVTTTPTNRAVYDSITVSPHSRIELSRIQQFSPMTEQEIILLSRM